MSKPNRANYDAALSLVESGKWRVDHATGIVYGKRGNPFVRLNSCGYVQIKFRDAQDWRKERAVVAHRVVWESLHGPLADDLEINHKDGVKTNNAIGNLEAISHLANVRHAIATGLTVHRQGSKCANALLSDEQVRDIYRRAWAGEDQGEIAAEYGVGRTSVSNIKCGWSWTHVTGHPPADAA